MSREEPTASCPGHQTEGKHRSGPILDADTRAPCFPPGRMLRECESIVALAVIGKAAVGLWGAVESAAAAMPGRR